MMHSRRMEEAGEALTRCKANFVTVRIANHRNRLPREPVVSLSLKVFKIPLHNCS